MGKKRLMDREAYDRIKNAYESGKAKKTDAGFVERARRAAERNYGPRYSVTRSYRGRSVKK